VERSAETTRDDPDGEYLKRNRWFESGSLQQRVCELSVPERRTRRSTAHRPWQRRRASSPEARKAVAPNFQAASHDATKLTKALPERTPPTSKGCRRLAASSRLAALAGLCAVTHHHPPSRRINSDSAACSRRQAAEGAALPKSRVVVEARFRGNYPWHSFSRAGRYKDRSSRVWSTFWRHRRHRATQSIRAPDSRKPHRFEIADARKPRPG
jgi:hypothetical protein